MKVPKKYWENTKIAKTLHLFPGMMGEVLKETIPAEIVRVQKFLSHIFYRWYFLENEAESYRSPYFTLEYRKRFEKWPDKGQFFPKPSLDVVGKKIKIDIDVDYINFSEQPFLIDLDNARMGKDLMYVYDEKYKKDIKRFGRNFAEKAPVDLKAVFGMYFDYNLSCWREDDQFVNESFNNQQWKKFWRTMLKKAGEKEGLGTDVVLDSYVANTRKYFPGFGILSKDLEDYKTKRVKAEREKVHMLENYNFWLNFSYYLLLPFAMYSHLLAPVFINKENFEEDVKSLLEGYYEDPMPIYSPCTALYLTEFGKDVFF